MAQITIDTEKDSAMSMKKMIGLLEHFIAEKNGEQIITNASTNTTSTNAFDMFGDQSTNSTSKSSNSNSFSTPTHNEDMFSMFSSDTPSSSPQTYGSAPTTIQSSEISAQDLLKSADETDDDKVEMLSNEVTSTAGTVKKDQDFFQLMHY